MSAKKGDGAPDPFGPLRRALKATDAEFEKAASLIGRPRRGPELGNIHDRGDRGRLGALVDSGGRAGALVELLCQSDFVAHTPDFAVLLSSIARCVVDAKPADPAALLACVEPQGGRTLEVALRELSAQSGERIRVGRFQRLESVEGAVGSYVHHDAQRGALVAISTLRTGEDARRALREVAMHFVIHEAHPLEQNWFKDERITLRQHVGRALGPEAEIEAYTRFRIGE